MYGASSSTTLTDATCASGSSITLIADGFATNLRALLERSRARDPPPTSATRRRLADFGAVGQPPRVCRLRRGRSMVGERGRGTPRRSSFRWSEIDKFCEKHLPPGSHLVAAARRCLAHSSPPPSHCSTVPDALSEVRRRAREASGERDELGGYTEQNLSSRRCCARRTTPASANSARTTCRSSSRRRRRCPTTCSGASLASCSRTRRSSSSRRAQPRGGGDGRRRRRSWPTGCRIGGGGRGERGGAPLDIPGGNTSPWEGTKGGVTPDAACRGARRRRVSRSASAA